MLFSAHDDGVIIVWNSSTLNLIRSRVVDDDEVKSMACEVVSPLMFHPHPDKQLLFSVCHDSADNATVEVWDLSKTTKSKRSATLDKNRKVTSIAVSEDGGTLLTAGTDKDHIARVWSLPDLKWVVDLKGHTGGIRSVEFSPVGEFVGAASDDKTIRTWSIDGCSCLKIFEGHTSSVLRALFVTRGSWRTDCFMWR